MDRFEIVRKTAGGEKKRTWPGVLGLALTSLLFFISVIIYAAVSWMHTTLNIQFGELLYTLTTPLNGSNTDMVIQCIHSSGTQITIILLYLFALAALLFTQRRYTVVYRSEKRGGRDLVKLARRALMCCGAVSLVVTAVFAESTFKIADYVRLRMSPSTLYEECYVDPKEVSITGEGKNLIYIYLESMETAYADKASGGAQAEINYIPGLTRLAEDNLSFSSSDKLGGFHAINGTTWTMGALLATSSGVPYSFPTDRNSMSKWDEFAGGLTTLGDLLEEKGYQNEFLCGSNSAFGGRRIYYQQHGSYEIFDLYTARDREYIPHNYYVWWGYEDMYLYEIAKDELTRLAEGDKPFNFTMLTVDTHYPNGYLCSLCTDEYDTTTGNVVACADRQVMEFIDWCTEQDFYEDSVIILTGDHPRMDIRLVENVTNYYDRTVYNCFMNSAKEPSGSTVDRDYTAMDMFPTTLSAMGFEIEGDRLGLGVDLFSGEPTLCEEMGFEKLEEETQKYSAYYIKNFA